MNPTQRQLSLMTLTAGVLAIVSFLVGSASPALAAKPTLSTAAWSAKQNILKVAGRGWGKSQVVTVANAATGLTIGTVTSSRTGAWTLKIKGPLAVPCRVSAISAAGFAQKDLKGRPTLCSSEANRTIVLSFNNLGMHCYDSDFSVFSILPPFNTVHAQVIQRGGNPVILDQSQARVSYQAITDSKRSINSTSAGKSNFWNYVSFLFGAAPAADTGLTGSSMPGSGNIPQPFSQYDSTMKWFTAEGIPITDRDDKQKFNPYPLMQIQPFDNSTFAIQPATSIVLPVSSEMHCSDCHATGGAAANSAALGRYGIARWSANPDPQLQYRENVLILHDGKHGTPLFANKPVLCASCHYSPALDLAGSGPAGSQIGRTMLSHSIHGRHGKALDGSVPSIGSLAVIPDTGIGTCYKCHPGATTQCLRGVMSSANLTCQNCHGGLLAVGGTYSSRTPWVNEPKCQSCHTGDAGDHQGNNLQLHVAYDPADPAAAPRLASNVRFAEEAGKLYRDSRGHGSIACEACHGSTHAEWPVADPSANDNVAAIQLQGYAGPITECTVCHGSGLALTTKGPHGLHNVNDRKWNLNHRVYYELNITECRACHGLNLQGTSLARTPVTRQLVADDNRSIRIPAGTPVSCTLCHENPLLGN